MMGGDDGRGWIVMKEMRTLGVKQSPSNGVWVSRKIIQATKGNIHPLPNQTSNLDLLPVPLLQTQSPR
jgi:hypothetical protein